MWWIAVARAATLSDAWDAAAANPDRLAAAAAADAAAARVGESRAAWSPKVQVAVSGTRTDEAVALDLGAALPEAVTALTGPVPPIEVQPQGWWSASATLVVPLVDVEGWATSAAAARARDVADAEVDVVELAVRDGAARAFAGLYVAREGVRIASDAVAVARSHREVAERLVAAGAGVERSVAEARRAELAAERDLHGARAAEIGAAAAFHRVTGLPTDTPLELGAPLGAPPTARPEVVAAEARVRAATAAHAAATLGWAPELSARVTALRNGNQGLADDPWFVVATAEATWTFDGGYRAAAVRESAATLAAARSAAGSTARAVEESVAVAAAELDRAAAALAAAAQEVVAARAALGAAEAAFGEGAATSVEVERAALGLRAAELSVAREQAAGELARARWWLLTGGSSR